MTRQVEADVAGPVQPLRLKKRPHFLRAAGGRKLHSALFTLQAIRRPLDEGLEPRVGFTVTKKVGNAVERNRIRRRLREVVRVTPDLGIKPSHDYVIVARRSVLGQPFSGLASSLRDLIGRFDRPPTPGGARRDRSTDVPRGEARPERG